MGWDPGEKSGLVVASKAGGQSTEQEGKRD
jgi:hypothetical protein